MTKTNASMKKLSLNKETIRSLTPAELDGVGGGTVTTVTTFATPTTPVSLLGSLVSGLAIGYSLARMM